MKRDEQDLPTGMFPDDGTVDADFLNLLSAEAIEYIHDTSKDQVVNVLTNTDDTAAAVGATAYKITKGLMTKYKPDAMSLEADMSHATALATEVTDMLIEVVEATQPNAAMDVDKIREEALMRAVVMHGEDVDKNADETTREEAQAIYANMMADGSVDEAFGYVNKRSQELGINPNDTERKGIQGGLDWVKNHPNFMQKKPLAQSVAEGVELERSRAMPPPDQQPGLMSEGLELDPAQPPGLRHPPGPMGPGLELDPAQPTPPTEGGLM